MTKGLQKYQHPAGIEQTHCDWPCPQWLSRRVVTLYRFRAESGEEAVHHSSYLATFNQFYMCRIFIFWIAQVEYQGQTRYTRIFDHIPFYWYILSHWTYIRAEYFSLAQFLPHRRAAHRSVWWMRVGIDWQALVTAQQKIHADFSGISEQINFL